MGCAKEGDYLRDEDSKSLAIGGEMNKDKLVAEMPKAEHSLFMLSSGTFCGDWNKATEAECKLLWEQGWRKVPSIMDIAASLAYLFGLYRADMFKNYPSSYNEEMPKLANDLHRWLMEGE